jgi:hypothetical protein
MKNQEEMIKIIYDNVRHLTAYPIEEREADLLYKLVYEVDSLDRQEFREALTVLESVYQRVRPSLGVGSCVGKIFTEQAKIAYMKKIFALIEKGCLEEIRLLSRDYINHNGRGNVFFLVWLISFGGTMILRPVPKIYDYLQRFRMQWALRSEIIPKWIH